MIDAPHIEGERFHLVNALKLLADRFSYEIRLTLPWSRMCSNHFEYAVWKFNFGPDGRLFAG